MLSHLLEVEACQVGEEEILLSFRRSGINLCARVEEAALWSLYLVADVSFLWLVEV